MSTTHNPSGQDWPPNFFPAPDSTPTVDGAHCAGSTGSDAVLLMELQSLVNVWQELAKKAKADAELHGEAGRHAVAMWSRKVAGTYECCGNQIQRLLERPSERQPHPNGADQPRPRE